MKENKELRLYIGNKIKYYRNKNKLKQEDLGNLIGVRNNTISAYERGVISPDSDILFTIAEKLNISVDDLFPPVETNGVKYLDRVKNMRSGNLGPEQIVFFQELIKKTLSMDEEEREKFLESIRFTVDYFNKMNQ